MDSGDGLPVYKRILLKISGEALMGPQTYGIHLPTIDSICSQIKEIHDMGLEIGVVVGGGNIFRGLNQTGGQIDRVTADQMGMLATVINIILL